MLLSLLSLAAPTGFVVLEGALAGRFPTLGFIWRQVASRPEIYAYLFLSSLGALALLGFFLGKKQDLLEDAWIDELTELANHRLFANRLKDEIRRSDRLRTPLALLLIDVDNLKEINDRGGGHEVGDFALRAVAESIRCTCRTTDLAARFGGDEFAVIAPFAEACQGMELAARIRKALASIQLGSHPMPLSLTVSIGVADLASAGLRTPEALCDAADRALYLAKAQGRDCAALAPSPPRVSCSSDLRPRADVVNENESANDSVREASGE